jgi:hypothetical protein
MCDAAVSLCDKLHHFMHECNVFSFSTNKFQESASLASEVEASPCPTPIEKCKESCNVSVQPVRQTSCMDALSTEAIFLSSPATPGLPRSLGDGDDRLLLFERELEVDDLSAYDPHNMRIHQNAKSGLNEHLQCSTVQSSTSADVTPGAAPVDLRTETAMFIKVERKGSLPLPLGQALRDISREGAHPGEEARSLLGLASKLKSPDLSDSPQQSRNACSPAPPIPTPQAARYKAERDTELKRSHSIGKKHGRRRKTSKENVGRNLSQQQEDQGISDSQPKSLRPSGTESFSKEIARNIQDSFESAWNRERLPHVSTSPAGVLEAEPVEEIQEIFTFEMVKL